jgi:hypothetical protein
MDTGTIIVAAVLVAICIMPFIFSYRNNRKREAANLAPLIRMAEAHQGHISLSDTWGETAIALDATAKKLFYRRKAKDREHLITIDLNDIAACKGVRVDEPTDRKSKAAPAIARLELELVSRKKDTAPVKLLFFSSAHSLQLNGEVMLLKKWEQAVQQCIGS